MSFSIGFGSSGMGPRSALEDFGSRGEHSGEMVNWQVIKRMLVYLRPHLGKMVFAFILTLGGSGLILVIPYLMKVAIDQYITPGDAAGLTRIALWLGLAFVGSSSSAPGSSTCSPGLVSGCWLNCAVTCLSTCSACTWATMTPISPV